MIKNTVDTIVYLAWMDILKLSKFWTAYDVDRWPTDPVSLGQVEATRHIFCYLPIYN